MQQTALKVGRKRLTSWEIFWAGAIAKTAATVVTYPIQLAQSRLRALKNLPAKKNDSEKVESKEETYANTLDVLIKVFKCVMLFLLRLTEGRKDGLLGWFAGLNVKVVQTVLTAAFQFLCYEYIKDFIFAVLRPKNAKAISSH